MKKKGMAMTSRAHTIKLDLRLPGDTGGAHLDLNLDLRVLDFASYDEYLKLQLNKTLDPYLCQLWATRDWDRKVRVFSRLQSRHLLSNSSRALCIGVPLGQEVAALKKVGVVNFLGVDLVPSPPVVIKGDFHKQPFKSNSFDFEFSNVFNHALYPDRFVEEIERTLKPRGVAVIHVASSTSAPHPPVESSALILPPPLLSCAS